MYLYRYVYMFLICLKAMEMIINSIWNHGKWKELDRIASWQHICMHNNWFINTRILVKSDFECVCQTVKTAPNQIWQRDSAVTANILAVLVHTNTKTLTHWIANLTQITQLLSPSVSKNKVCLFIQTSDFKSVREVFQSDQNEEMKKTVKLMTGIATPTLYNSSPTLICERC